LRICSFIPSATETIYALGLADQLCGVTHECDYPPQARLKPKLTKSELENVSNSREIDAKVRDSIQKGSTIYSLDFENLSKASPDIIFTQELCEVCAVSFGEINRAVSRLQRQVEIVSLDTFTLKDILDSILKIGSKCDRSAEAHNLVKSLESRIEKVSSLVKSQRRDPKRVFFMEWVDPIMSGGHWMAEIIMKAGGRDIFAIHGKNSQQVQWSHVVDYAPEYLIIAPCGFEVDRAEKDISILTQLEGWADIPAVRSNNVFVANGNAYFSRPGPRIVDGLEILYLIMNPERGYDGRRFSKRDYRRIELSKGEKSDLNN
jgi:iron complex transport system substrate-binding protein